MLKISQKPKVQKRSWFIYMDEKKPIHPRCDLGVTKCGLKKLFKFEVTPK